MTVLESLPYALFMIAIVIGVLSSLCLLFKLFSVVAMGIARIDRKAAPTPAMATAPAPAPAVEAAPTAMSEGAFSSGQLKLIGVDEPTAAMIMAIVCEESGIPLEELRFKSIRAID